MAQIQTVTPALVRGMMALLFAIVTAVFTLSAPAAQAAPKLSLQSRQVTAAMPVFRKDFQQPNDGGQVFYIQRSPNSNTVVYAARVSGGQLDAKSPVSAYWRRFNTDGAVKGLNGMERRLAYGVSAKSNGDGTYNVSFKALPTVKPILRLEKGRPALFTRMGDEEARMIYAYLDVDDGGLFPRVTGLKLVGRLASGKYVTETYRVTGGEL